MLQKIFHVFMLLKKWHLFDIHLTINQAKSKKLQIFLYCIFL